MLTKKDVYQVEVTESDHVQVRTKTLILEDGEVISSSLHRHVISPGQDASGEVGRVRRAVAAAHVPEVVAKYQTEQAHAQAKAELDAEDTPANRTKESDAKTAMDVAKLAHKVFIDAEG